MTDDALSPRKKPRQARAAQMVSLILEAATRVLARQSLAGFNTNRVAEVAGISVGSLYQYFPNKSALVVALIEREQKQLAHSIEIFLADNIDASLHFNLSGLVDIAIEHQYGNPLFAASLDHEEQHLPLQAILQSSLSRIVLAVNALLERPQHNIAGNISTDAARDCLLITKALIESEPTNAEPDLTALKQRAMQALQGYLQFSS